MEKEQPRETVSIVVAEKEFESEERGGGFEDYTEEPILSPITIEETTTPVIITESRGKRRTTSEESSNRELLILLK